MNVSADWQVSKAADYFTDDPGSARGLWVQPPSMVMRWFCTVWNQTALMTSLHGVNGTSLNYHIAWSSAAITAAVSSMSSRMDRTNGRYEIARCGERVFVQDAMQIWRLVRCGVTSCQGC